MSSAAIALIKILIEAIARFAPAIAAYFAGKKTANAEQTKEVIADVEQAKKVSDVVNAADGVELKRLRNKWTKK